MKIIVNQEEKEIEESLNLYGLLTDLELESRGGIAVAVNETVIPRSKWEQQNLQANDQVTIISAFQGG